MQGHLAALFLIVVFRLPTASVVEHQGEALVLDRRDQGIPIRVLQRRQVNERLDQGTDRTARIHGAIETGVFRVTPTNQGQHLSTVPRGHYHGGFQRGIGTPLHSPEHILDGKFRRILDRGVQGGEDAKPLTLQIFLLVIPGQVTTNQIDVGRVPVFRV